MITQKKSLEAAEFALLIAKNMNSSLIIVNVLQTEPWLYGKHAYEWGSEDELDKAYHKEKERIEQVLNNIKNNAEKISVTTRTEIQMNAQTNNIASTIVEFAENEKVDLIVVGTRGASGVKRMLLGSVASGVVTYAHCPVLVVK
ncbi:universal stress protein [Candidatus Nitrosocosmicus sp.]|nr:universal stress protein [Candidatus Nitrosocosmicus sp.]